MAVRIWAKSSARASSACPTGYSSPKLLYSLRRSSRVSSVPMLFSVMFSARLSACAPPAPPPSPNFSRLLSRRCPSTWSLA